jgi:hypothetical protein
VQADYAKDSLDRRINLPKLREIQPGAIKETVTQERIITPDEQPNDDGPRDAIEFMESIPPEEQREYLGYLYRTAPEKSDGHIGKFEIPFDLDFIRENFGGGEYKVWVKKGSHIRRTTIYKIIGTPKTEVPATTTRSVGAGESRSEIVQLFEQWQKNNPQNISLDILKKSFENALEIQRSAAVSSVMKPSDITSMMRDLHSLNAPNGNGGGSDTPSLLKDLLAACIPVVVTLFQKIVTPTDPVAALTQMSTLVTAARQLGDGGGGGAAKEDLANVIVKNGPGLLDGFTKFLAEMRNTTMLKIQQEAAAQANRPITIQPNPALHTVPTPDVVHPAPPRPAQPTPAAAAVAQTPIEEGAPTPQWVLKRVREMIESGQAAEVIYDFLDIQLPDLVTTMRSAVANGLAPTPEALFMGIQQDEVMWPILAPATRHANWEKFFKDFYQMLKDPPPTAPSTPVN